MLTDAWVMARKDLRIEWVSRVASGQVLPFGLLVLIVFGFAVSPDLKVVGSQRAVLAEIAPGLFWVTVLLAALLALGRSFSIESVDGNLDALKMAGLEPGGVFLGKAFAVAVQLVAVEFLLGLGAFVLYGVPLDDPVMLLCAVILATTGMSAAGTLYAGVASGLRSRDTLVPLLVLPILAPVLLAATLATEAAVFGGRSNGWSWVLLLAVFAAIYVAVGTLAFGPVMEES